MDHSSRVEVRPGRTLGIVRLHAVDPRGTMFFIHGVGGSAEQWKAQMMYFHPRGWNIVGVDLYGHGRSDAPESTAHTNWYTFDALAQDLLAVFDLYSLKACVCGKKGGGSCVSLRM